MNHSLNMQKLTTTKRPTGLLTSHSREKTQLYMICKGTELAVWLMSPKLFWVAYLAIAPAKVAAPSSSWHGGSPAMESCLPTITSPELLHSYETLLTLGFKTVKAKLDFAVERTAEWEQAAPAMGETEEVEVAGGGGLVVADTFSASAQKLLPNGGPFGVPISSLAIHQHAAYTQIQKRCVHLSFAMDLKPWSSHHRQPAALS